MGDLEAVVSMLGTVATLVVAVAAWQISRRQANIADETKDIAAETKALAVTATKAAATQAAMAKEQVELAKVMKKLTKQQVRAGDASLDLERRKQMGALPIVTFVEGWTATDGVVCLLIGLADAAENRGWAVDVHSLEIHVSGSVLVPRFPWLKAEVQHDRGKVKLLTLDPIWADASLPSAASNTHLAVAIPVKEVRPVMEVYPNEYGSSTWYRLHGSTIKSRIVDPEGERVVEFPMRPFPFDPGSGRNRATHKRTRRGRLC